VHVTQSAQWIATARLLRRAGFGTTGTAVDAAVRTGAAAYIASAVAADYGADPGAKATPPPTFDAIPPLGQGASKADRQQRNTKIAAQLSTVTTWWIRRMVAVDQPFGEKVTFTWHNHFATAATKVRSAPWLLAQNQTLRRLGRGDFRTLALAMLTDAAMLRWLDGEKNTAKAPNENLSREFMELFTLGHGDAYTETDVREGARALTGWRINPDGTTRAVPRLHDNGSKTVLGVTGNLDCVGFCDAVLAQPGAARYLATRTWGQLVSDAPPASPVVDRLVAAYGAQRDLSGLLREMFTMPQFATTVGTKVINPVEWLIGAVRALRVPVADDTAARKLVVVLRALGQVPFYPPNVSGWPSGHAWLSTAAADARVQAATALAAAGDLTIVSRAAQSDRVDAAGYLLGIGSWTARSRTVLAGSTGDPKRLVAVALTTPEYLTD
jgi:uncharacterized protein (DUF1800 family)